MDKKEMRKIYLKKRNSLSEEEIFEKSKKMCDIFFTADFYKRAEKVFTYINYKSEFNSSIIIERALSDGKTVCVPVMSKEKAAEMFFVEINNLDTLSLNSYGIYEPELDFSKVLKPDLKTIMIVPGLAFDKKGYRLGYGGGYYDKYIRENKDSFNIGFAFEFQLVEEVVHNEYDVSIDMIFTEGENLS